MNPSKQRTKHLPPYKSSALGFGAVAVLSGLTLTSLVTEQAQAAIVITGAETGGNVVFSYTGSLDTTGLASPVFAGLVDVIAPSGGVVSAGQSISTNRRYDSVSIAGPGSFGTGGINTSGVGAGDIFAFALTISDDAPSIILPQDYVSGTSISGTLTFNAATFMSLGVDDSQSYVWTLDDNGDTITLQFGSQETTVPEGDNVAGLVLLGMGAIGIRAWRKRK